LFCAPEDVDGRDKPGHDERPAVPSRRFPIRTGTCGKDLFIISVDRIFTVLMEPPFTNVFDRNTLNARIACVCHARNAD
jgi:hypothetical protein